MHRNCSGHLNQPLDTEYHRSYNLLFLFQVSHWSWKQTFGRNVLMSRHSTFPQSCCLLSCRSLSAVCHHIAMLCVNRYGLTYHILYRILSLIAVVTSCCGLWLVCPRFSWVFGGLRCCAACAPAACCSGGVPALPLPACVCCCAAACCLTRYLYPHGKVHKCAYSMHRECISEQAPDAVFGAWYLWKYPDPPWYCKSIGKMPGDLYRKQWFIQ
jgi:hypothetical protein